MDQPCSFEDLRACLRSIASVNRVTFAHFATIRWLESIAAQLLKEKRTIHLVDVGCGYGDLLRRIDRWATAKGIPIVLTGIDLNIDAIRAACEATRPGTVTYHTVNAFDFHPPDGIDLVVSSLLTHHLQDEEIVEFLKWMEAKTRVGWFVNDLHRQRVPYYAFRMLRHFTRWHAFVKHDGPVSIQRSFRQGDWDALCVAAAIPKSSYTVLEHRPARLCVARVRTKESVPIGADVSQLSLKKAKISNL